MNSGLAPNGKSALIPLPNKNRSPVRGARVLNMQTRSHMIYTRMLLRVRMRVCLWWRCDSANNVSLYYMLVRKCCICCVNIIFDCVQVAAARVSLR